MAFTREDREALIPILRETVKSYAAIVALCAERGESEISSLFNIHYELYIILRRLENREKQ